MNEIKQRGPVVCDVYSPPDFHNYTSGIYVGPTVTRVEDLNHAIEVVGWGEENGQKYWFIRNSWGSFWGENGFGKVLRGSNNIGIELDCSYGVPKDTWTNPVFNNTS